jgi:hypothetical protein
VLGGEGQDVAPAGDGLGLQEERGDVIFLRLRRVILLLFLDSAVVVDKGEGVLVVGVAVPLGTLVSGTEVALEWMSGIRRILDTRFRRCGLTYLGIVLGKHILGWCLLLASVWELTLVTLYVTHVW